MEVNFLLATDAWIISLILFVLLLIFCFLGMKAGRLVKVAKSESLTLLTTGIYTILGLLLAFSFSMSGTRFDERKKVIVQEANNISTAVLRSDMYPDSVRKLFMVDFKKYLETRIEYFEARGDLERVQKSLDESSVHSERLWQRATELSRDPTNLAASNQMIPALNAMFDIATERMEGELYKVPDSIIIMLLVVMIISSFVLGYTSFEKEKKVDWYIVICFNLVIVLLLYFILDLDRPRRGIITLDEANNAIVNLRSMFK